MALTSMASSGETTVKVSVAPSAWAPGGRPSRSNVNRRSPDALMDAGIIGPGDGNAQSGVGP
jgi:hypothetical protein